MRVLSTLKNLVLAAGVSGALSLAAVADGREGTGVFMQFFDANQDKTVTMDELRQASKDRFGKMDADGNAAVTVEEFQSYVGDRKAQWRDRRFSEADLNGDSQVSRDEYLAYQQKRAEQRYQDMDANNDGALSKDEYQKRERGFRDGKSRRGGGDRFFSRLDANNDSQLTLDESLDAWSAWFKRIDANNDQTVTEEEVKAFRQGVRH